LGFRPATGHLGGCRGKELCKRSLAVLRPRPPVRVHPPPRAGVGLVPPTVCGVGSSESRVVCGKQKWGSRSPAAVRCFDSARKRAHSKRFAKSKAPWESRPRMDCGGLPPLCVEPGLLTRCYHHGLRPGRWVLELQEGRCARGNGGPAGGSLREHRWRRDDRSTQRRKQALGSGAVDASCWEDPCPFHESGQFWAPAREEAVLGSEPAGATSAGACCSGTAAPPKVQSQGSQKYAPQGATRWKKPLDPWDSGA
jgi:hypothetical protein